MNTSPVKESLPELPSALEAIFLDAIQWGRSYGQRHNVTDETLNEVAQGYADKALAATAAAQAEPSDVQRIGPNELEAMAKARPDDKFLKGSGVLKLLQGIRLLEREIRALQAIAAPREGWEPIASAPHGRKLIAGYPNKLGKWRTVMACYYPAGVLCCDDDSMDCDDEGYAPAGWYEECESQDTIVCTDELPTHWMPLPTAPLAVEATDPKDTP